MNDRLLALGICTLIAAGLVGLFFLTYTKEEYQEFVPPLGEARHNPMLAAQRLLGDLGYDVFSEVEFAPSLSLPDTGDTIVVGFNYRYLEEEDVAVLMSWVGNGGHLVIEILPRYGRTYDPIFTALGIEASVADVDDDEEGDEERPADAAIEPPVTFPDREFWGDLQYDNRRDIDFGDNEPIWSVRDERGVFAGQIGYDEGLLTIAADLSFLNNQSIAKRDHAFVLTRLIGSAASSGNIWLYYGGQFPSLMSLLWEHAHFLFKAGAVVLLLLLWWAGQRFGPRLSPPATARKAFLEHISANGRFLWRHHQQDELLAKTQRAFLRDAQRRHAGARTTETGRRAEYLSEVCDIARDKVDNALGPLKRRTSSEFIEKMQVLNLMWKRI